MDQNFDDYPGFQPKIIQHKHLCPSVVHSHQNFATMPLSTTLSDCRKATLKKLSFIPIAGLKGRLAISDIKQQWTTLILLTDIFTVFRVTLQSLYLYF